MIRSILELLAGYDNCIKMLSPTLKYDNDSIEYKVCMEMRNRYHFQMSIGKSVTRFNEINKCSFDFLNQFNYY